MIGEIRVTKTPFFDKTNNKQSFKSRPALVIGQADSSDYVVLPVSRVTNPHNIDTTYDVLLDPVVYPALNLKKVSYVRTHKQTVIHDSNIDKLVSNLKMSYEDLYIEILAKMEDFQKTLLEKAV